MSLIPINEAVILWNEIPNKNGIYTINATKVVSLPYYQQHYNLDRDYRLSAGCICKHWKEGSYLARFEEVIRIMLHGFNNLDARNRFLMELGKIDEFRFFREQAAYYHACYGPDREKEFMEDMYDL